MKKAVSRVALHIPITIGTGIARTLGSHVLGNTSRTLDSVSQRVRGLRFRTGHVVARRTGVSTRKLVSLHTGMRRRGRHLTTTGTGTRRSERRTRRLAVNSRVERNALRRAIIIGINSSLRGLVKARVLLRSNGVISVHR